MISFIIKDKLSKHRVSSGDNLLGFEIDADHFLSESALLDSVIIKRSGDPRCALTVSCKSVHAAEAVEAELESIWLNTLRYEHWEAHEVTRHQDSVSFAFITTS